MRGMFLLLLLSNLVYLAWQYLGPGADAGMDPYRGVTFKSKGLELLSELPPDKRPALREGVKPAPGMAPWAEDDVAESPAKVAEGLAATEGMRCMRVAGIGNEAQLRKLQKALKALKASAIQQGSEVGQAANGKFWVMLPPYPNLDKATEAAAILKQHNIKDFFVVRSGDYENAVSLGVFSTRERAERRNKQISALKIGLKAPKVEAIGSPAEHYWLSFSLGEGANPAKIRSMLKKQGVIQVTDIRCQ